MNRLRHSHSLPFTTLSVLLASVFFLGSTASAQPLVEARPLSHNETIILQQSQAVEEKSTTLQSTIDKLRTLEGKKEALAKQLEAEKQKIEDLKQRIAEKRVAEERARQAQVVAASTPVRTVSAPVSSGGGLRSGCGDNQYAAYIYGQESGGRVTGMCNTTAMNAGGCFGIGQACPGSKVARCGSDYACQNEWFTGYALGRYKSWAAAYNFHRANGWW